eukprot:2987980-Pyramimonas_sp.AAC.1
MVPIGRRLNAAPRCISGRTIRSGTLTERTAPPVPAHDASSRYAVHVPHTTRQNFPSFSQPPSRP